MQSQSHTGISPNHEINKAKIRRINTAKGRKQTNKQKKQLILPEAVEMKTRFF